jgi:protocatechuate 3,4-dioxygenase beta subunit
MTPADELDDHDRGLSFDVSTLLTRRAALTALAGASLASLAACRSAQPKAAAVATTAAAAGSAAAPPVGTQIPEETAGPFPGDGSNGANVLTASGIVRSNLTASFGTGSAVASGVPLAITLTVLDTSNGSAPLAGAAVYIWHCDALGRYSLYSDGVTGENYLRGVQQTDAQGVVRFASIYPGTYPGRWPHAHFEIYPNPAAAAASTGKLRTTQLALPEDVSKLVYAGPGYDGSTQNLSQLSLDTDSVFRDGYSLQLAKVTGTVAQGLAATLNVPV